MRKRITVMTFAYELTKIKQKPLCVPDIAEHHTKLLDLFLTCYPDQCSTKLLLPLGISGNSCQGLYQTKDIIHFIEQYTDTKTDWDSFRFYNEEGPLFAFFKNKTSRTASLISE